MLPRIKEVKPMPDYCLRIVFDDGRKVLYDVKEDMDQIESYRDLATIHGLFNQVQLDPSRTCVYWNDENTENQLCPECPSLAHIISSPTIQEILHIMSVLRQSKQ